MKVFKKVMPLVLAVVCVLSVGLFAACRGNGNDYSEDIAKLQEQIDKLKEDNQTLKDTVTEQDEQIKNQQTLIENLQNGVTTAPKVYHIGETFTYRWNGTDYFSISFDKIVLDSFQQQFVQFTIENLNFVNVTLNSFVFYKIKTTGEPHSDIELSDTSIKMNQKQECIHRLYGGEIDITFGFPLPNKGILPYAILDLSTVA